jgi:hypothetical protein
MFPIIKWKSLFPLQIPLIAYGKGETGPCIGIVSLEKQSQRVFPKE